MHQPQKAQSIIEYSIVIMLVMSGILIGGPYAIRAVNAHLKGWEDSVHDSMTDPLRQADDTAIPARCDCDGRCEGPVETLANCCYDCGDRSAPDGYCCVQTCSNGASIDDNTGIVKTGPNPGDVESHPALMSDCGETCGNGVWDFGEECDQTDLHGADCRSRGYLGGTLACYNTNCTYDERDCYDCDDLGSWDDVGCAVSCGDAGTCANGEMCQTRTASDSRCPVAYQCVSDSEHCSFCGDGRINGSEQCDGSELNGQSCGDFEGYDSGTLSCHSSTDLSPCTFDLSGCYLNCWNVNCSSFSRSPSTCCVQEGRFSESGPEVNCCVYKGYLGGGHWSYRCERKPPSSFTCHVCSTNLGCGTSSASPCCVWGSSP